MSLLDGISNYEACHLIPASFDTISDARVRNTDKHWQRVRVINLIESTFATVRHRTTRAKIACRRQRSRHWRSG
jgi:hypothetical protein